MGVADQIIRAREEDRQELIDWILKQGWKLCQAGNDEKSIVGKAPAYSFVKSVPNVKDKLPIYTKLLGEEWKALGDRMVEINMALLDKEEKGNED